MPIAAAWAGPVNVNTADASTIAKELEGIGPAKAAGHRRVPAEERPVPRGGRPAQGRRHRSEGARPEQGAISGSTARAPGPVPRRRSPPPSRYRSRPRVARADLRPAHAARHSVASQELSRPIRHGSGRGVRTFPGAAARLERLDREADRGTRRVDRETHPVTPIRQSSSRAWNCRGTRAVPAPAASSCRGLDGGTVPRTTLLAVRARLERLLGVRYTGTACSGNGVSRLPAVRAPSETTGNVIRRANGQAAPPCLHGGRNARSAMIVRYPDPWTI
jgi:hypothetical protein